MSVDNGMGFNSSFGVAGERFASADASGAAASVSDLPVTGKALVIDDIFVSVDTAMRVDFKEETTGKVLYSVMLPAGVPHQMTSRGKLRLPTKDKRLQVQTSASGNIWITAFYHSER